MKAIRNRTPSAKSDLQYQSWRVNSAGPPQLALEISPFSMNAHQQNMTAHQHNMNAHQRSVSTHEQKGTPSSTPPHRTRSPAPTSSPPDPASPIAPLPRRPSGLRRSSGFGTLSREQSPAPLSHGDSYHLLDNAEGKAGKSGLIIRQLGNDKDRLQRQLNQETVQRQDAERDLETTRSMMQSLRDENANMKHVHEADALVIKRRDRQLEDAKAALARERELREHHQNTASQLVSERDDAVEKSERETSQANTQAKHATVHAEVLEQSLKQLKSQYQQRFETMSKRLEQLVIERDEERRKVSRLDVVVDQMSQQVDRSNKLNSQMGDEMQAYKAANEQRMDKLMSEVSARAESEAKTREETDRVLGEARWLINVGKNTASRQGLT